MKNRFVGREIREGKKKRQESEREGKRLKKGRNNGNGGRKKKGLRENGRQWRGREPR